MKPTPYVALEACQQVELGTHLRFGKHPVPAVDDDVVTGDHHRGRLAEDVVQIPDRIVESPGDVIAEKLPGALLGGPQVRPAGNRNESDGVLVIRRNCVDDG